MNPPCGRSGVAIRCREEIMSTCQPPSLDHQADKQLRKEWARELEEERSEEKEGQ